MFSFVELFGIIFLNKDYPQRLIFSQSFPHSDFV